MQNIRVRFAPSPTGALHIGGVRTALYNYLFARKLKGTFILRIEDTDQKRYVPGSEAYIMEALKWCGLEIDEGPEQGGDYGPYRQSERKHLYKQYALQLIDSGHAYYAFDTPEALDEKRNEEKEKGNHNFKYDYRSRVDMENSLTLSEVEVSEKISSGTPYVIRLKVPHDESILVNDLIRGEVVFQGKELDDKVIFKADGMPTYHLANVVDDYLMKVSHVIRGEEWLPSTAHHVLLYRFLGWEQQMPQFAHLPLILKPTGKGKLSKRDGKKLGIPVFPLSWKGETEEDSFEGFKSFGFDPRAVINFLAFLGWNPGTEQEIFEMSELIAAFAIEQVGKSGARFDFEKAKWFNQQYMIRSDNHALALMLKPLLKEQGYDGSMSFLAKFAEMMKERVVLIPDFLEKGYYFFEQVKTYDQKAVRKKWKEEKRTHFDQLLVLIKDIEPFETNQIKAGVEQFIEQQSLKFGDILPILRLSVSGTMKGPAIFELMELLGKTEVVNRMKKAYADFDQLVVA